MSKKLRLQQTRAGPGNLDANAEEEEEKFRKWYLDGPTEVTKRILELIGRRISGRNMHGEKRSVLPSLVDLDTLGSFRSTVDAIIMVIAFARVRRFALSRRSRSHSQRVPRDSRGASGSRYRLVSQEAGTRTGNRSSKVNRARQSVVIATAEVPVIVEATGAGEEIIAEETRGKCRGRCLSVDSLLRGWSGKWIGRSRCTSREKGRGGGRRWR
jgi:hypothetical protein